MKSPLLVLATPRCGSTMLASALTKPGERIVLNDPLSFASPFRGVEWTSSKPWGIKATMLRHLPPNPNAFHKVAMLRDPDEILRSMADKAVAFNRTSADRMFDLRNGLVMLDHMAKADEFIRYEDVIHGRTTEVAGWPLDGDATFWVRRSPSAAKRMYEITRHGTRPSPKPRGFERSAEALRVYSQLKETSEGTRFMTRYKALIETAFGDHP